MKSAFCGRVLFGAAALLFGIITLMWRDPDTWQNAILRVGAILCACLAIGQIVGGIGLPFARTSRAAAILLGIIYALFSLACIPGIVAKPTVYVQYGNFFEWFALVCGAVALYATTQMNGAKAAWLGAAARIGLGICTVSFTVAQVVYFRYTASLVPTWIPPNQLFWTMLTTVAFALAAIAILIGLQARLALRLMTLMLVIFGVLVWIPRLVGHPDLHGNWSEFALNFLIAGAVWVVAENGKKLAAKKQRTQR